MFSQQFSVMFSHSNPNPNPNPEQVLVDAETLKNKMSLGALEKVDNEIRMNAFQWFLRFASEYKEPRG